MTPETRKSDGAKAVIHRDAPDWTGRRSAAIGGFRCESAEAGAALLEAIARDLAAEGVQALIGPMDGDTWHSYRLVTESDGSAPFLMEPSSAPRDLAAFEAAGFAPISHYFSARARVADALGAAPPEDASLVIRPWDGADPEAHFARVHDLSTRAFAGNPFYRPIGLAPFLALYMPFVPMLRPELILMAEEAGTGALQGFLFGIPNYQEGPGTSSVILKTYASLRPGGGHALAHAFHLAAHAAGFETVIHALIHDDNRSAERSRRHGAEVFRRYALMGRVLDG
jgi:hypothetical protein